MFEVYNVVIFLWKFTGKTEVTQGKYMANTGNFVFQVEWKPCQKQAINPIKRMWKKMVIWFLEYAPKILSKLFNPINPPMKFGLSIFIKNFSLVL